MKALIIDDEKHVREAVKILLDWDAYGITEIFEAQNGIEAEEIIERQRPQIIFTDMRMPIKGGMELMEWISANAPTSKMIVISGYDDFKYVRHAVHYGGIDYILKPIDVSQLSEAVERAVKSWREEEEARNNTKKTGIMINEIRPLYWDSVFSNMLKDPDSFYAKEAEINNAFGITSGHMVKLVSLSFETIDISAINEFGTKQELFFFFVVNICNEVLENHSCGYAFKNLGNDREVLILIWDKFDSIDSILRSINDGFKNAINRCFDFGVSKLAKFPEELFEAYLETGKALKNRNLVAQKNKHVRIHHYDDQRAFHQKGISIAPYEEDFKLSIRSGDIKSLKDNVNECVSFLKDKDFIALEEIELYWHEYEIVIYHLIEELFKENSILKEVIPQKNYLSLFINANGELDFDAIGDEMRRGLLQLFDLFEEYQKKDSKVIYEIARHIEKHCTENISLQDIASTFFLSREYISRKFKQELGENISDFICRLRIQKAEVLLRNPKNKVKQVAQIVGYEDEKYFCKVFKKINGMSPNEYRNRG